MLRGKGHAIERERERATSSGARRGAPDGVTTLKGRKGAFDSLIESDLI